jgi:hypothetical protein
MKTYKNTKQIYYTNYSNKLSSSHKNYWADIDTISRLISLSLEQYYSTVYHIKINPKWNYNNVDKHTTIRVTDYKEKFGEVRVYWHPADPELVEKKYNDLLTISGKKNKETLETIEDFRECCYIQDIIHYRNTYFTFRDLMPHYWTSMFKGADNPEYLYDTKEEYEKGIQEQMTKYNNFSSLLGKKEEVYKILEWK